MNIIIKNLNFTKFLDDNVLIAQSISLILFFESYSLLFYNLTIVNMKFDIEKIRVLPFIILLTSIATSKVIWFIIVCLLPWKLIKDNQEISTRTSYSSFILTISILLLLIISFYKNQSPFLVSYDDHPFLFSFLATVFTGGFIGGGYVFVSYSPRLGNWK